MNETSNEKLNKLNLAKTKSSMLPIKLYFLNKCNSTTMKDKNNNNNINSLTKVNKHFAALPYNNFNDCLNQQLARISLNYGKTESLKNFKGTSSKADLFFNNKDKDNINNSNDDYLLYKHLKVLGSNKNKMKLKPLNYSTQSAIDKLAKSIFNIKADKVQ